LLTSFPAATRCASSQRSTQAQSEPVASKYFRRAFDQTGCPALILRAFHLRTRFFDRNLAELAIALELRFAEELVERGFLREG